MPYFPAFVDFSDKKILIVGGGKIALHKARVLSGFSKNITLLAPFCDCDCNDFTLIAKEFEESDINGFDAVIGATNNSSVNDKIFTACRQKGIFVNIVDNAEKSDFIFPAVHCSKNLVIAVSTSGKSPVAAGKIRDDIKNSLPEDIDEIIDRLNDYRNELKKTALTIGERKALIEEYYEKLNQNRNKRQCACSDAGEDGSK